MAPPCSSSMTTTVTSVLLLVVATFGGYGLADTSSFLRCPLQCQCLGNYTSAVSICNFGHLTDIPKLPVATWKILITGNNITRLRGGAFSELHKVTRIKLRNNNIRAIDERAFDGVTSLEHLLMREERLSSLGNGAFRFFTNLTTLSITAKFIEIPQRELCRLTHLTTLRLVQLQFSNSVFDPCFEELNQLRRLILKSLKHSNISGLTFHPFRNSLKILMIKQCGLRRLNVDMFKHLSKLSSIDMSNNDITDLPINIFAPLTRLTQLVLSGNNLKVFSSELLRPLQHLKILNIGHNSHVNLTLDKEFVNMTSLNQIILNGIKLRSINNATFEHLRFCPLFEIGLKSCSLSSISNDAFRPLRNLTSLRLGYNPLNNSVLHNALFGLQKAPLQLLNVDSVNLKHFSSILFEGLTGSHITSLSLKTSLIPAIQRHVFRNLREVDKLDMSANKIVKIEDHSFVDIVKLSHLNLDHNNIVELYSAKRLSISPTLSVLTLRRNSIKVISMESLLGYDNLTRLYLTGNNIRTIAHNAFVPTPRLTVLDLGSNAIELIQPGTFDTLPDLLTLNLQSNSIMLSDTSLFQRLQRLENLDISGNAYFGRQPSKLVTVLQNMSSLVIVDLHGCGIETLPVGMFTNTTQLHTLVLSDNSITSWDPTVFAPLRHLRILTLERNQIVSVNVASFSHLTSLRQLDLSFNPFACNCDLMWFIEYVQMNNIYVINIGSASSYTCASPESLHGVPVLNAGLSPADCVTHTDLVVTLSTAAAIFLSAIVFALVYRGRWYIRYYVFLIRARRRRYLELADGSYVYDAFVAHNSNDASWVVRHLLPRLETEGRYRLCLHQRDWPIGREISENIVESIEASRKVIVVLSNNFAQSQWCRMELEMANHRRLSNWRNSLILVLLETILPENQTATLRILLTTHTYLEWNERAEEKFWRALRKALRPPKGAPPVQMRSVQGRNRFGERERGMEE